MSEEMKALVRRFYDQSAKDLLEMIDELVAADFVYHRASGQDIVHGPEGYKQVTRAALSGFPDLRFTVDDIIGEGDKVVTRWTLTGTHTSEFRGIPPTGKKVMVWGISIDRILGGKIVETWERYDTIGLMQQLNILPPPRK